MTLLERYKFEEWCHDEWARSMSLDTLNPDRLFACPTTPENSYALSLLGDLTDKRLLDIGCGSGESSVFFAKRGAFVQAVDIAHEMVDVTRRLAAKYQVNGRLQAVKMAVEDMEFADGTFDLIYGRDVLHHLDLNLAIPKIHRVLKLGGKAVFTEPLGHNPIIAVYRRLNKDLRTPYERPLTYQSIAAIRRFFRKVHHKEFQLSTLAIFLWFFFVERKHPGEVRYWKKIIEEADSYSRAFALLHSLDEKLFKYLPFLQRYCWITVIELLK